MFISQRDEFMQKKRKIRAIRQAVGLSTAIFFLPAKIPGIKKDFRFNPYCEKGTSLLLIKMLLHLGKPIFMEGITILKNESNNHRLMQIDLDALANDDELLEDVYDLIAIELRKNEETIPWERVRHQSKNDCRF